MHDNKIESQRTVLTSFEDVKTGVVSIASLAERQITILTPDLEPGIYDSEEFLEALKRLVLARRYAKVRVLISDPRRTVRNGNQLVALARRLNSFIEFRNLHPDFRGELPAAYIIADDKALLYRANGGGYDGIMGNFEPVVARQHLAEFEQPWEASVHEREEPLRQS